MGCDIHVKLEVRDSDGITWKPAGFHPTTDSRRDDEFWDCRSYAMFSVLAGVRNYSAVTPLTTPRGFPSDMSLGAQIWSDWGDFHSPTYYVLSELLTFNYDAPLEDRRNLPESAPGRMTTYREFMTNVFFRDVERLRVWATENDIDPEDVRIIMAFDN